MIVVQSSWSILDKAIEAVKIAAALLFLYLVFSDLTGDRLFRNLFLEWHWGRFLTIAIAYFVARKFFHGYTLREIPIWVCLLWTFYGATVIALMVWAGYGTHTEDADPLFGGGTTVVDFVPTAVERDLVGSRVFVDLLLPALLGTYLTRREDGGDPMPPWLARAVKWTDFGIGGALGIVVGGVFYIGTLLASGYVTWAMGSMIVERAEVGWYLVWAIPLLLFLGSWFLLVAFLPLSAFHDWRDERRWKKLMRSPPDDGPPAG